MSDLASVRRRIFRKYKLKSQNNIEKNTNELKILNKLIDNVPSQINENEKKNFKSINDNVSENIQKEIIFEDISDHPSSHISLSDYDTCNRINIKRSGFIDTNEYVENMFIGDYVIIKELGSGSSAKVYLAYHKNTERKVAIKVVTRNLDKTGKTQDKDTSKNGFNDLRVFREAIVTSLVDHPHIIKLFDFMYSENYFFLVFEYVKGQSLYDLILKNPKMSEEKARKYFRQLVSAIDYLHKNCIIHRDLKIENIVVDDTDNLKLIDFGLSNFYDNSALMNTFCGSLYFAAPELLLGQEYSGPEVDVWSMGIILYVLLYGKVPFDDDSIKELQNKIKIANVQFNGYITSDAKDLILHMIVPDPVDRHTLQQIIDSKWINIGYPEPVNNFMLKRNPITKLNPEYALAVTSVLSFQFSNAQAFLNDFVQSCRKQNGKNENVYWLKHPVVSLYYLLIENIETYCSDKNPNFIDDSEIITEENNYRYLQNLHNFVRLAFANDSENIPSKFFPIDLFPSEEKEQEKPNKFKQFNPTIKKSYLKGIFQGIKVKHIGSHNALKKVVLDVLKTNSIAFEIDENGYFCTYKHNESECYFKVSLYYNLLFNDFYMVLKCLNSAKESFKVASEIIQDSLNNRH